MAGGTIYRSSMHRRHHLRRALTKTCVSGVQCSPSPKSRHLQMHPVLNLSQLFLGLAFLMFVGATKAQVPSPHSHLGFTPGADGRLASYDEILGYHRALSQSSDRVMFQVAGHSTEGREMVSVVISSPENLRDLDTLRKLNAQLAYPNRSSEAERDDAVDKSKVFILLNESIHSNEVGPAQASMVTAHFLATTEDPEWKQILNNCVLILTPCHNPDGYATIVNWWRRFKDDPERRGVSLPILYHKYVGHDNNRDWFMLTQAESRVTARDMHIRWRPQVVIDQHQMGSRGARMFIPPFIEPYEPFVHPNLKAQLAKLGPYVVRQMADNGMPGVWHSEQFDAWTPARAYQHYHGAVRVLTEVASAKVADPHDKLPPPRGKARTKSDHNPAPWTGGRWGLDDIVRYCSQGALWTMRHASENRKAWLLSFRQIQEDFSSGKFGPEAFAIPADSIDPVTRDRLIDIMQMGDLKVATTTAPFNDGGREFPEGSLIIPNRQAAFGFAAALLTNSPYPEIREVPGGPIRRPYDATCHYLPLMMGFECHEVALPQDLEVVKSRVLYPPATAPRQTFESADVIIDAGTIAAQLDVLRALGSSDVQVQRLGTSKAHPRGAYRLIGDLELSADHVANDSKLSGQPLKQHRIGVYWSWLASMDEGWLRFFFDSMDIPWTALRPADLRAGGLADRVDVLVFADVSGRSLIRGPRDRRLPDEYKGGLGDQGKQAIEEFVKGGGTLVTLNRSSELAIDLFKLPLDRIGRRRGLRSRTEDSQAPRLSTPGSALMTDLRRGSPLTFGLRGKTALFVRNGDIRAWSYTTKTHPHIPGFAVTYQKEKLVGGGFAEGTDQLAGRGCLAHVQIEKGDVVMFAWSPHFRCQTWGTFPLLLNALMTGADRP